MHGVRLQFVTACTVYAYNVLPHARCTLTICYRMHGVRLQFVTACVVYAYKCFPHAQYCIRLQSTKYLEFFIVHGAYANNLLPHAHKVCLQFAKACAQGMLTIRYCMRRVCLQFATACLEYANKANHTQILSFQLNQVKTYSMKKVKKIKKAICDTFKWTSRQSEITFFCANSK